MSKKSYNHPSYDAMVLKAVEAKTERRKRKGCNANSIYSYINATFDVPDNGIPQAHAKKAIAKLIEDEQLKKVSPMTYRLTKWPSDEPVKKKKKVVKRKKKTVKKKKPAKRKKRKSLKSESKVKRSKKKKRASKAKKVAEKRKKAVKKSRKK